MTKKFTAGALGVVLLALLGAGAFLTTMSGQEAGRPTILMGDPAKGELTFSFLDKDGKPVDKLVLQNNVENQVTLVNKGQIPHELRSDLFRLFQFDVEIAGVGEIETVGIRDMDLEPGKQVSFIVKPTLSSKVLDEKNGQVEFEVGCFIPGHYVGGMKGTIVVTK
ncbi:MAG: hypothetical protein A2Z21_06215 [Candidatus Fraserbacteria bacterium RBG_16_55_9]|uniref:EfeO-type cupredoxin-like domain-containing protein n=1 Tax=Fraserbacteria sp. (strain RBG_16_55_9) TaxID=1817864 RepID=A0A1F5UZM8_FRAXR|nr:MAG: hypothetical protein A2Z21_06215 [Candidatus Fraserbacteria bacterium RBG_16_55_9]